MVHIHGSLQDDQLQGTQEGDVMFGYAGDDILSGGPGDDTLHGGLGNDRLLGGAGNDFLYGNAGDDCLEGGPGYDHLRGGAGNDRYIYTLGDGFDRIEDELGENTLELRQISSLHIQVNPAMGDRLIVSYLGEPIVSISGLGIQWIQTEDGCFPVEALVKSR
uniref:Hemolysin-type calcium-binding region n=1 Tax=Cyanothece sp. (strain PCC 7425 / ATCC 29141) TaxID=395961 RepID=B8HRH6_CYAP4